jgi:DNA-binding response OmpR family regulator
MYKQRIVVAEGRADTASQLCRCLQVAGTEVATAASGAEALRMAAQEPPDLLLLDLFLPDMPGGDLLRSLRENHGLDSTGIIVLGGGRDETMPVISLDLGADDFLTCPFSDRELLARVRAVLRRCGRPPRVPVTARRMDEWTRDANVSHSGWPCRS